MKKYILLFLGWWSLTGFAQENNSRLVVGITVSQFYPEWLTIYRNDLGEGGLKRLMSGGKKTIADYDYLFSQSGTDQVSIYTGLLPSSHGIVAHDWYERLKGQRENNVASGQYEEIDGDTLKGYSPERLQYFTLGCAMKMENGFSKIYSIGANPEEAILSGGSCADMAFWLNEKNGKWTSSRFYADSLPVWLKEYNNHVESDFFVRRGWMPLSDEQNSRLTLKLKSKVGIGNGFFYDIAQAKRKFNTYRVLKATPYINTMIADLAGEVITANGLGKDNDVDLLMLNFSSLDYMNRDFGVYSKEFQDLVLRLDRNIEKLFQVLDQKVGKGKYTVFLTFSEARELLPEELQRMKVQGGYFSIFKAVALLKSYLNLVYGDGEWVIDYDAGQLYLNRELIEKQKLSLKEMQDRVADFMVEFEGVSKVLTAYSLTHNAFSQGQERLIQNAFFPKRSGDVLYCLQPSWIPELNDQEDFYFRYSKRNKVPLYFFGAGLPESLPVSCKIQDILPSLCQLMGITVPYSAQGKTLFQ